MQMNKKGVYFATSHAMEEELLRSDARHEAAGYETAGSGRRVVRKEGRQRAAGYHEGRPLAFQLDLAQKARYLHGVHARTLRSRLDHQRQVVVREESVKTVRYASPAKQILLTILFTM